jgi:surfeit locus 1 family protein
MTLPMLAALLALGTWQLHRMEWKAALIEEVRIRGAAPAIVLPIDDRIPAADLVHRPVRITGRFMHEAEMHLLNRVRDGKPGINLVTPFMRSDGGPTLLVDRGWAPMDWRGRVDVNGGPEQQEIEVTGVVRAPDAPGWLTPANRPDANEWYYIDLSAMAGSVGILPFVDYYIYATGESPAVPDYPVVNVWQVDLPNNHLSYAITWFSLAVVLLVIYFVYHARPAGPDRLDDDD